MRRLTTATCLVLAAIACSDAGTGSNPDPTVVAREPEAGTVDGAGGGPDPTDFGWELESGTLDGTSVPIIEGHPITLAFTGNLAEGSATCNFYMSPFSLSATTLTFAEISVTEARCHPEALRESHFTFVEALSRVERYVMTEANLTLTGEGAELVFVALPPRPADDPTGVAWGLEAGTLDGAPVNIVLGFPITLSFTEEWVEGTAACNDYFATYSSSSTTLTFGELGHTAMGCIPEEVMESESAYLWALSRVHGFSSTKDRLTLIGEGVELVFVPLPPAPITELTGKVWLLVGLFRGDAVSNVGGDRATLELYTDGSMLASTGCRSLHASYVVSGAEIRVPELAANGECPPDLQDQDGHVIAVLGDRFRGVVDGRRLIVTSQGGLGLAYRAVS